MPERSTIAQQVQVGVESTPGTAVPADKLLTSLGFDPSPQLNIAEFAPPGFKFETIEALLQEWSTSGLTGYPTYTEIVYPLSSVLMVPTPVTASGVTTWTFLPKSSQADVVKTFTVERGDGVQAERTVHTLVNEFGINFSPTESGLSGNTIGRALETGVTLTATPTALTLKPILPRHIDVFVDPVANAFGTTKLTRCLRASWSVNNRFGPLWVLNSSLNSFAAVVELKPVTQIELQLEADAVGMSYLADVRAGTQRKIRIKATSTENIGVSSTPYSFTLDGYVNVAATGGLGDQDGVYAATYTFRMTHNQSAGEAYRIVVVTDTAAL